MITGEQFDKQADGPGWLLFHVKSSPGFYPGYLKDPKVNHHIRNPVHNELDCYHGKDQSKYLGNDLPA